MTSSRKFMTNCLERSAWWQSTTSSRTSVMVAGLMVAGLMVACIRGSVPADRTATPLTRDTAHSHPGVTTSCAPHHRYPHERVGSKELQEEWVNPRPRAVFSLLSVGDREMGEYRCLCLKTAVLMFTPQEPICNEQGRQ